MLDNRELKKLLVVVLGIVVLLGVFVGVRSCDKANENEVIQEDVDNSTDNKNDVEVEEEKENEKEEDKTSNNYEGSNNTTVKDETVQPEVEQVEQKEPVVTMKDNYVVNVNNSFNVPSVNVDDNGEKVTTAVSYEFLAIDSLKYVSVLGIDTSKLGTYKVTYKISNEYKTIVKVVYVEIVDNELPTVTANKLVYEEVGGQIVETAVPILDGEYTNENVYFAFEDNDQIAYAEYYKAIKEIVNGEETIEKEAMENVIDINLDEPFYLIEDGEYHIRVVDRSGNTTEFVVTIDKTNPVEETREVTQNGDVEVKLTFDEKIQEVEGWLLSEDKKTITKIYTNNKEEIIKVKDLAGNEIPVTVKVTKVIDVKQNGTSVRNEQNISSADATDLDLIITSTTGGELEVVTPLGGGMMTVNAGTTTFDFVNDSIFSNHGDYTFKFTDTNGNVSTYTFTLSQELIGG